MLRILWKRYGALSPILLLVTLTLITDFYGNHSGIPPESPKADGGSFPPPMEPHGNLSGRNSTAYFPNISTNLESWRDKFLELIPSGPIFRVGVYTGAHLAEH